MPWVPGLAVRVLTHEHARTDRTLVVDAITDLVKRHRLAGLTVTRALEGLSGHGQMRVSHALELGEDLPIVIELVDRVERIEPLLPQITELLHSGVLTVYPARVYFPVSDLRASDVMRPARIVARPEAPLRDVVYQLLDGSARLIPVVDDKMTLLGIITLGRLLQQASPAIAQLTERWTVAHVRAQVDKLVEGHTAGEAMLTRFETLRPDTKLDAAAKTMTRNAITRIPVVDHDRHLLGILSERALVAALVAPLRHEKDAETLDDDQVAVAEDARPLLRHSVLPGAGERLTAGTLADQTVPELPESTPWQELLATLRRAPGDTVLVVDADGAYKGAVDADDVLRRAMPDAGAGTLSALRRLLARAPQHTNATPFGDHPPSESTAGALMRASVPVVSIDTPVAEALEEMLRAKSSDLAVVLETDGRPRGLLHREDALRALVEG